jgi:predicted dehydrogenase
MEPVRFGIVSTALIARRWMIPAMRASPYCKPVGISSRDPARAASVARELGIAKTFPDLDSMLADPDIEAVYIATPNSAHVGEAVRAAESGRHVLCEKPLGLSAAEAEVLVDVQRRTGVQMTEAFMVRYHPRWLAAREVVRSGRLGEVRQIHATYSVMNDDPGDIRFKKALGGGSLFDVGVYPITAARFLFAAEPTGAFGRLTLDANGVDLSCAGVLEFPGERHLMFSASLRQAWAHWIMVTGTDGWMEMPTAVWPDPGVETCLRVRGRADLDDAAVETISFPPANQYEHEVEAFAKAVRGLAAQPWPIADALAGLRALDAVRASARSGAMVGV